MTSKDLLEQKEELIREFYRRQGVPPAPTLPKEWQEEEDSSAAHEALELRVVNVNG